MNQEMDTCSKIKMAALNLFNEKGYSATTTREIANEVGIKSSTLYFYFKSKEDIFLTLYREARELFDKEKHARLSEITDESIEEQLYTLFIISMDLFTKHNLYCRFLFIYLICPVHGIQHKIQEELDQWAEIATAHVQDVFFRGKQEGLFKDISVDNLVKSFYRNQNGYIYLLITSNKIPGKEEIDEVWKIYWDGIKA